MSVGNVDQVPLNKKLGTLPTEQQVHDDISGTSQPPQVIPPTYEFPMEDIREEVQRRVHIARQQEIQRQVDQILKRDRLVRENRDRLAEATACAASLTQQRILHIHLLIARYIQIQCFQNMEILGAIPSHHQQCNKLYLELILLQLCYNSSWRLRIENLMNLSPL
ncbi:hypothetical protein LIER_19351 [Lithospermum erythrorhizon]|uniref:Uncharacterized protein n=1 Tax=Lithospermum erythrorhizon TaxID=34254 RepID=A0AAV3QL92_LITER